MTILSKLILYIIYIALSFLCLNLLPTPLKAIARSFLVLFHISIWSPSIIYCHLSLLPSPSPPSTSTPYTHIVPILQSWFLLLIFKLMYKGVSQCMPTVCILYFGPFNPIRYFPLPLYLPPLIFQELSVYILESSIFISYILQYYWCSVNLFSFPSVTEFHRVVPLLRTCCAYEFV
jgi:hypothetical protein